MPKIPRGGPAVGGKPSPAADRCAARPLSSHRLQVDREVNLGTDGRSSRPQEGGTGPTGAGSDFVWPALTRSAQRPRHVDVERFPSGPNCGNPPTPRWAAVSARSAPGAGFTACWLGIRLGGPVGATVGESASPPACSKTQEHWLVSRTPVTGGPITSEPFSSPLDSPVGCAARLCISSATRTCS